jgi:hypothetical protein
MSRFIGAVSTAFLTPHDARSETSLQVFPCTCDDRIRAATNSGGNGEVHIIAEVPYSLGDRHEIGTVEMEPFGLGTCGSPNSIEKSRALGAGHSQRAQ